MSLRRVRVWIDMLPPTSALARAIQADHKGWTVTEYMLAHLIDVAAIGNWLQTDTKKSRKPKPYPRPADLIAQERAESVREERARLRVERQKAKHK